MISAKREAGCAILYSLNKKSAMKGKGRPEKRKQLMPKA
jgi:hypothetical protein